MKKLLINVFAFCVKYRTRGKKYEFNFSYQLDDKVYPFEEMDDSIATVANVFTQKRIGILYGPDYYRRDEGISFDNDWIIFYNPMSHYRRSCTSNMSDDVFYGARDMDLPDAKYIASVIGKGSMGTIFEKYSVEVLWHGDEKDLEELNVN